MINNMTFEQKLKALNPVDFDMMTEIIHNAPISHSYGYDCNIHIKEPSYVISQKDMVKLMNYVYKILR